MATLSTPSQGNVFTNYYNQLPNNTGRAVLQHLQHPLSFPRSFKVIQSLDLQALHYQSQ